MSRPDLADTIPQHVTATEITVVTGIVFRVEGDAHDVERMILDAARGSIMQFAWLVEVDSGERVAINPEHVVTLRALDL